MAKLFFLLSVILGLASAHDGTAGTSLRRTFETDVSHHRELSMFGGGWSWSNLLFKIGVCHHVPAGCPGESESICPCPDCSKPLIPPHLHTYCKCIKYSMESGSYSDTMCSTYDGENYNNAVDGDGTSAGDNSEFFDKTANQQGATRTTKLWAMILAGGTVVAAAAVGAVAYRKRQEAATETKAGLMTGDYVRTGTKAGIFAGALAAVGLSTRGGDTDNDDRSTVSRRMQMMNNGEEVEDLGTASPRPSFVNVSAPMSGVSTSIYQSGDSIEVEGPVRPSSSYGYAI